MAKPKRPVFAFGNDNLLFIELAEVMNSLIAMWEGLTLVTYPNDTRTYIRVTNAIACCRDEAKYHSSDKYKRLPVPPTGFDGNITTEVLTPALVAGDRGRACRPNRRINQDLINRRRMRRVMPPPPRQHPTQ
jgi:hypothetical protein